MSLDSTNATFDAVEYLRDLATQCEDHKCETAANELSDLRELARYALASDECRPYNRDRFLKLARQYGVE